MYERTYRSRVLKEETKKPAKKKTRIPLPRLKPFLLTVGAIVLLGGFVFCARASRLQVQHIDVQGASVADPVEVATFVSDRLTGTYLHFLPKTSILLVPERSLMRAIKDAFPRFETVAVSRKNATTITVSVTEYGGVYLWCADERTCFFMDKNGIVFADAPVFSGSAYPKLFIGTVQELPFTPITSEQLSFVALIIERLHGINIDATEFHFMTDHEVDIVFPHNQGTAKIMVDPTLSADETLNTLFSGLRTQPLAGKFHDATKTLEYIDLRFEHKVVYRFQ